MNNQRGFTLIETMIYVAILPILATAIYMALSLAHTIFYTNDVYSRLNVSAMQTLRSISREVGQTSPNTLPSHLSITTNGANNVITFQVPVDWDNDGDATTGSTNPTIEWGAYDYVGQLTSGRLSAWTRYAVNGNNQLERIVLDNAFNPLITTTVCNNVQAFTVTRSQNNLTMNITLRATDQAGNGRSQRNFTATFSSRTMLRNAVN